MTTSTSTYTWATSKLLRTILCLVIWFPLKIYGFAPVSSPTNRLQTLIPLTAVVAPPQQYIIPETTKVNVLSKDPLVYVIPQLLSPEECQAYQTRVQELQGERPMTLSNPPEVSLEVSKLWPLPFLSLVAGVPPLFKLEEFTPNSIFTAALPPIIFFLTATLALAYGIVLPLVRQQASTKSRTSQAMAFNLPDDMEFCQQLVQRVSTITNHPWQAWEAPVVTRYDPGAIFAKHGDASPTRGTEWTNEGGQRVITCICYLNTVQEGGETSFDRLNLDVAPRTGDALIFFPADPVSLMADPRTTHESLPPAQEKWIVQLFGRTGPRVPPPLGLPDEFGELLN